MATQTSSAAKPRRGRKLRIILVAIGFLGLTWLAPTLLALSPARHWIAQAALARLHGSVHVGRASLGWFTTPTFENVEVRDASGRPLLLAPRLTVSQSLAALLRDSSELGTVRLERPTLEVHCAGGQTNLEQAFASWLQPSAPESSAARHGLRLRLRLEVYQARLLVHDDDTGNHWELQPLDVTIALPRDPALPRQLTVRGEVAGQTGVIDGALSLQGPEMSGHGHLDLQGFPLGILTPFLRRLDAGARLDGRLHARLTYQAATGLKGHVTAEKLTLSASALGTDTLQLDRLEVPCQIGIQGKRVRLEQLELTCALGRASLAGTFDLSQDWLATLSQPGHYAALDLDLARLAHQLPATFHLRKETTIASGRVSLEVRSSARPDGVQWEGKLRSADLRGNYQGQALVWPEPLTVSLAAHRSAAAGLVLDRLKCESDFLRLDGSGSLERATLTAQYDLDRLADRLGRFVDLGGMRLAGSGSTRLALLRDAQGGFKLDGDTQVRQLLFTPVAGAGWQEPGLNLRIDATGKTELNGPIRLNTGVLRLEAGSDTLTAQLLEPSADVRSGPWGKVQTRLSGDLGRWQQRLRSWVSLPPDWQASGQMELNARLRNAGDALTLDEARLGIRELRFRGAGLIVQESTLDAVASGRWLTSSGRLDLNASHVSCPTVAVNFPALALVPTGKTTALAGAGTLRGDLARLQRWLTPTTTNTVSGVVTGRVSFESTAGGQVATIDLALPDVQAFGCQVGKTDLKAALRDGWVRVQPIDASFNQGRLRLQPNVRLDPEPTELQIAGGAGIEKARLTPAACAGALGYALPILAEVTEADGEVSVALESGRIPLSAPNQADLRGRIIVHAARLGPSPLLRELGIVLKGPATVQMPRDLVVPFAVVNGRVYHQNLELIFPDLTIRTHGSVGLDGTLALIAEMPVPPKWLNSQRLTEALAKQTIRIPIAGTLNRPKLDEQALRSANAQFARGAAADVFKQELDRQLQRLLAPKN